MEEERGRILVYCLTRPDRAGDILNTVCINGGMYQFKQKQK